MILLAPFGTSVEPDPLACVVNLGRNHKNLHSDTHTEVSLQLFQQTE